MKKDSSTSQDYEAWMYRQMKSEKFTLNHVVSGSMLLYRQIHLNQFRQVSAALTAYEVVHLT